MWLHGLIDSGTRLGIQRFRHRITVALLFMLYLHQNIIMLPRGLLRKNITQQSEYI